MPAEKTSQILDGEVLERCVFCGEEREPEGFEDGLCCVFCAEDAEA